MLKIIGETCCFASSYIKNETGKKQGFNDMGVSDQGSVNCLDSGPCCSNWFMHVWEEGKSPSLGPIPPDSCVRIVSRDSEGMEANWGRAASPHRDVLLHGQMEQAGCISGIIVLTTPLPLLLFSIIHTLYILLLVHIISRSKIMSNCVH
jgi:hypothetical protein